MENTYPSEMTCIRDDLHVEREVYIFKTLFSASSWVLPYTMTSSLMFKVPVIDELADQNLVE